MVYDERRQNCFCEEHCDVAACKGYYLKFKGLHLSFSGNLGLAIQTLYGLRAKAGEGVFDARDYMRAKPLGYTNLVERFLEIKKMEVGYTQYKDLEKALYRGVRYWGNCNIKSIREGEIEDFLYAAHLKANGDPISETTRAHIRSAIHQFFAWLCRRERSIAMPAIPFIKHHKKYRDIVSIEQQQAIIAKVRELIPANPKIWLAIHILSHNSNVRPGELLVITHGHVRIDLGVIVIREAKEGDLKPKYATLWPEEIAVIQALPRGVPLTKFFVHPPGTPGVPAGTPMHVRLLNQWIKKAIKSLGMDTAATLYSITRHSTITAMSSVMSPEQIRRGGTTHASRAMDRYMIPNKAESDVYQDNVRRLQKGDIDKKGSKNTH
jgi:hypothetical protein